MIKIDKETDVIVSNCEGRGVDDSAGMYIYLFTNKIHKLSLLLLVTSDDT